MPDPYIRPQNTKNTPNGFPDHTGPISFLLYNLHNGTETPPADRRGHHTPKHTHEPFWALGKRTSTANSQEVKRKSSKEKEQTRIRINGMINQTRDFSPSSKTNEPTHQK